MSDLNSLLDSMHQDEIANVKGGFDQIVATMPEQKTYASVEEAYKDMLGVPTRFDTEESVKRLIMASPDPQGASAEWEASKRFGEIYGMDPLDVFGHSDVFAQDYFGKAVEAKTAARAVADSFKAGIESMREGLNGAVYAKHVILGTKDSQYAKDAFDRMKTAIEVQKALNYDPTPRSFFVKAEKWVASSLPYMGLLALSGGATGAVAEGAVGIASRVGVNLAARQVIRSVIADGLNVTMGASIMGGQDFSTMVESGIDEKTAAWFSLGTGLINSSIEQVFGIEGAYSHLFAREALPSLSSYITKKAFANGLMPSIAANTLVKMGISQIAEPTEEGMQAFVSDVGAFMAQSLQAEGTVKDPMTLQKMGNDIAENMWQAFVTAPVLGLLPHVSSAVRDSKVAKQLVDVAPSMTKPAFVQYGVESKALDAPEDVQKEMLGKLYDTAVEVDREAKATTAQLAAQTANELAQKGGTTEARLPGGGLRVQSSQGSQRDETVYTAGHARGEEAYGSVVVRKLEDGSLEIVDGEIIAGHEGIARELMQEMSARAGTDKAITISEDIADPSIQQAFEWMRNNNPNGKEMGANWNTVSMTPEDEAAKNTIRAEADKIGFVTTGQREVLVANIQMMAQAAGISYAQAASMLKEGSIAVDPSLKAKGKAGSIQFQDEMGKTLDINEAVRATKAIIHLAENSNFAAVLHEFSHYFRVVMSSQGKLSALEAHYGVKNGQWTEAQDEAFANDHMAYEATGKSPTPEHQGIFDMMKAWLGRMWKGALSKLDLAPEVKAQFDEWYGRTKPVEQAAEATPAVKPATEAPPAETPQPSEAPGGAETASRDEAPLVEGPPLSDDQKLDKVAKDNIARLKEWIAQERRIQGKSKSIMMGLLRAELKAWESGAWRDNPSMVARAKEAAGIELTIEDKALNFTADLDILDQEIEKMDKIRFMGADELVQNGSNLVSSLEELTSFAEKAGEWKDWHDRHEKAIKDHFGSDSDLFKKILAATSQAASVPANVALAVKAYSQLTSREAFHGYLPAVVKNLERIRADEELSGRKISEYGKATSGNMSGIAIDRHVSELMFGVKTPSASQVEQGKAIIRQISDNLGWDPRGVQAALWAYNQVRKGMKPQSYETFVANKAEHIKAHQERAMRMGRNIMFMDADDIINKPMGKDDVMQGVEALKVSQDKADYSTFEDWLSSIGDPSRMSDKDKAWLRRQWDFDVSKKEKAFKKPGDFTRWISAGDNLVRFMMDLHTAINAGYANEVDARRAKRFRDLVSSTPEITDLMDQYSRTGARPSDLQQKKLTSYIRRNEATVKFLYAELRGDTELADEAISDLGTVPDIKKREFLTRPRITLEDQAYILKDISDEALARKVADKSATFQDMVDYSNRIEEKYKATLADLEKSAKDQNRMDRAILKAQAKEREKAMREREKERNAARKVREHIRRLQRFIMHKIPQGSMMLANYRAISYIQDFLENSGDVRGMALKNLSSMAFTQNPRLMADTISFLEAFKDRGIKDLSIDELSEIAQRVDLIAKMGRKEYAERHMAYGLEMKRMREEALKTLAGTKYSADVLPNDDQKRKRDHILRIKNAIANSAAQPPQFVTKFLDGHSDGWHYKKLILERIVHDREKYDNYDRRTGPVTQYIKDNHLEKELFKQVAIDGLWVDNSKGEAVPVVMTYSDLVGVRCLIGTKDKHNDWQRESYIYGNLFSEYEKDADGMRMDRLMKEAQAEASKGLVTVEEYLKANPPQFGDRYMMGKYKEKLDILLAATENDLTPEMKKVAEMMIEVTDNQADWERFASVVVDISQVEPTKEKYYFPLMRLGILKMNEDAIADAIQGAGHGTFLDTGMTMDRKTQIAPRNQKPVKTDAMHVFFDAIMKQEHLTNMGSYAKELHGIYLNPQFSGNIRQQMEANLGPDGWNYLKEYIDEVTSPMSWKQRDRFSNMVKFVRGTQVVGNLAWRWTTVLMQMATSPLPFMAEAPAEMLEVLAEAYTHNPLKWYKSIEAKSATLRHRQFEPMQIVLEQMGEEGVMPALRKFANLGMTPLQFADRFSVAMGWEACYRKRMRELEGKATEAEAKAAAELYADEVVKKTQPSTEDVDRSPMYRDMTALKQMILQFTQPLNVIFNNVAYDAPQAWKEGQRAKAIGILTVYAFTGMIIGAVQAARGNGPAPDDEGEKDWVKFFTLASMGQFLEMIPLGGDYAALLLEAAFNKGKTPFRRNEPFPMLGEALSLGTSLFKDYSSMTDEQAAKAREKAVWSGVNMIGLGVGAPVRAMREYWNLAKGVLGATEAD